MHALVVKEACLPAGVKCRDLTFGFRGSVDFIADCAYQKG